VASLGWCVSLIQRAEASQKRINNFLQDKNEIINQPTTTLETIEHISFNHVTFVYPDTGIQALTDINFDIKKGEKIAIVGKTGSGKSTIAELLLRTYDVENGSVTIKVIISNKLIWRSTAIVLATHHRMFFCFRIP
jgi:ATP-binding cassette subfamily B protein